MGEVTGYLIMVLTTGRDRKEAKARKLLLSILRIGCGICGDVRATERKEPGCKEAGVQVAIGVQLDDTSHSHRLGEGH